MMKSSCGHRYLQRGLGYLVFLFLFAYSRRQKVYAQGKMTEDYNRTIGSLHAVEVCIGSRMIFPRSSTVQPRSSRGPGKKSLRSAGLNRLDSSNGGLESVSTRTASATCARLRGTGDKVTQASVRIAMRRWLAVNRRDTLCHKRHRAPPLDLCVLYPKDDVHLVNTLPVRIRASSGTLSAGARILRRLNSTQVAAGAPASLW